MIRHHEHQARRPGSNRGMFTGRALTTLLALAVPVALAGCDAVAHADKVGTPASASTSPAPTTPPATVSITPADGSTDVPTAVQVASSVTNGTVTAVELTDGAGVKVDGAKIDGSEPATSWLPATQLAYGTPYTATVTATAADGRTVTATSRFTTMAKPGNLVRVSTPMADDATYGVAMPIIVNFASAVPNDQRAAVQRRILITSSPPQEGGFHWFSGTEVHFRPKEYWQSGTKLSVRVALGGQPLGGNRYGARDLSIRATIGSKIVMTGDNATNRMTVTEEGQAPKVLPVSFGKASTPSSSGHMVIMAKNSAEWFDSSSYGVPANAPGGYHMKVYWTQRITSSGQYLHAADWSVDDQGRRNVSHGCTNLSPADAQWLYKHTHVGDPVIITGSRSKLSWGNGWTDWDRPFDEYVKGSAVPYTAS